ncbi:AAA family ATPase [uncultured Aliivibrio sp.]|uniref:AAA family ATPase n=1 Tax=uncultured Aliivibrio sp. TaxID=873085 RepID=UPI0026311740|nr:AAA family ATPase [uncultured Aliivibrio sp.]
MRLNRLKLVGRYKSIVGTEQQPFIYTFKPNSDGYSPICLVGLNGSGKSNFIELIADIFGYADRYFNPQYDCAEDLTYDFEIDYQTIVDGHDFFIKIKSTSSEVKMYSYPGLEYIDFLSFGNVQENRFQAIAVTTTIDNEYDKFLPDNVLAYSSGNNQGLSSVFAKTQLQYFDVIRKQGVFYREYKPRYDEVMEEQDAENDAVWEGLSKYVSGVYKKNKGIFSIPRAYQDNLETYLNFPEEPLEAMESSLPIGLFVDHSLNDVFFVYLMVCRGVNKSKSQNFRRFVSDNVNINGVRSFEIDLRLTEYKEFETVGNIVRRLTELSCESLGLPVPLIDEDISFSPKLHFKLGRKFLKAMERLYLDETVFLHHLLTLHHLTAKRWSYDEKRALRSSKYERNVPNVSGGLMPMRIMNVEVMLKDPHVITTYDRISDGEHQLIQILGSLILFDHQQTLFILDEPESHFNPEWRIEFINIINDYVDLSKLELIISTHSPFVLSACKSKRVLHFMNDQDGFVAIQSVGDKETYGSSLTHYLRLFLG